MQRNLITAGCLSALLVSSTAFAEQMPGMAFASADLSMDSSAHKSSYIVGVDIGASLREQGLDLSIEHLLAGFQQSYLNQPLLLTDTDIQKGLESLQREIMETRMGEAQAVADSNLSKGLAFMTANAENEMVKTLDSGLQYEVMVTGEGAQPQSSDTVKVHYRGTFIDGTEFDSSYSRNEPSVFPVTGVIAGWTEALMIMPAGSKWRVVVPPNLGYGEFGAGNVIGPNETLVFEIELLSIES